MTEATTDTTTVRTLQPDEFACFGGHSSKDGKSVQLWIPGPEVIRGFFGEDVEVDITVREGDFLQIKPRTRTGLTSGFGCARGFWSLVSDLDIIPT